MKGAVRLEYTFNTKRKERRYYVQSHDTQTVHDSFRVDPGTTLTAWYIVGGGGGHKLYITGATIAYEHPLKLGHELFI